LPRTFPFPSCQSELDREPHTNKGADVSGWGKKLYFEDAIKPEGLDQYRGVMKAASGFLLTCAKYGGEVIELCAGKAQSDPRRVHGPLLGLVRHHVSYLDSISLLVGQGGVEACLPLIRSNLEANLGIAHILHQRHEERALAYQLAKYKRLIKAYRQGDRNHADGQKLQATLVNDDIATDIFDAMTPDLAVAADEIEKKLLADPVFAPILVEWDRLKAKKGGGTKEKDPDWYTLFDGAHSIRELAKQFNLESVYVFVYKTLSDPVHAGNALDGFAPSGVGQSILRPLRHPGGLPVVFQQAFILFAFMVNSVLSFYDPASRASFGVYYKNKLRPDFTKLHAVVAQLPEWPPPRSAT
jgi:hypothetical protein